MIRARLTKSKRRLYLILLFLVIVGAILYGLADRYLIQHVEIVVQDHSSSSNTTEQPSPNQSSNSTSQTKYDDWNYTSEDIQITIDQVESGSGADKITYYVADVQLMNGATLQSAFADNSFGRNIIEYTSEIATENDAILAINGDYYGFRDDGVIIRNGTLFRDEPARTGLALLDDGTIESYEEDETDSASLLAKGVLHTLSFGPVLIKDGEVTSNFDHIKVDTNFGNRSIQNANPRTGIGLIAPNHYVFVVVDGRKEGYSRGMTLTEFADVFANLGCTEAYNLDGGGSSTMYFMGRVVNNPLGKHKERGVSDILYVKEGN